MAAERTPQADYSLMSWPLRWLTQLVTRFPSATLLLAGVATVVSLVLTVTRLGFHTSRAELMNPNSEYSQRWVEYTKEFGDKEDVVIVVEGDNPKLIVPVLDELAAAVAQQGQFFCTVLSEIELSKIRAKGLHFLKAGDLAGIDGFLNQVDPVLQGNWSHLSLAGIANSMGAALGNGALAANPQMATRMQAELGGLCDGLLAALNEGTQYRSPWPETAMGGAAMADLGSRHLLSDDGRMGFVLLRLAKEDRESFAQNSEAIDALHRLMTEAKGRHPETKIGLTGLPAIENDEMRSSNSSMTAATLLSLFGVFAVLVVAFGGFRHSLMAMGALLLAMIWSCGWITLTIGHVNVLSIAFGSVLLGIGIDYGVYYVARYLQLRENARSTREAIVETAATIGPGITTGAVTSAIAFFAIGFTDFSGVAQLGMIAGAGILLCWLAEMTVLPATIQLADSHGLGRNMPVPLNLNFYLAPLFAKPRLVLLAVVAGTVAIATGMPDLWYDYNLLHMQPVGLESVDLEHKLCNESNRSAYFALSISDTPENLLLRKAEFLALPTVERVEEIASLFATDEAQKRPLIEHIAQRLANLPQQAPQLPLVPQADLLQLLAGAQMIMARAPETAQLSSRLSQVVDVLRRLSPADYQRRLCGYQQSLAGDLLGRLHALRAVADPRPPQPSDLPEGLTARYIGAHGRFLQKIYAKVDLWDMEGMKQFTDQVRSVDPQVTGNPLIVYEASQQMKRSYQQAAWYALLAIVPVVLFDYRRLGHTLLAILPMGVGMLQTFGLLGALDIAMNPANMIVLPLILGIGIESGVNIVHDFRNQGNRYRRISNSTTVAVVVNSLTTMVGFGALMIANHRGLQSLGRVLTIAMGCCLFSSLVLPNLLVLYRRSTAVEEPENAPLDKPLRLGGLDDLQSPEYGRYAA